MLYLYTGIEEDDWLLNSSGIMNHERNNVYSSQMYVFVRGLVSCCSSRTGVKMYVWVIIILWKKKEIELSVEFFQQRLMFPGAYCGSVFIGTWLLAIDRYINTATMNTALHTGALLNIKLK